MNAGAQSQSSRPNVTDAAGQAQLSNRQFGRASDRYHADEMGPPPVKRQVPRSNGRPGTIKKAAFCWIAAAVIDLLNTTLSISLTSSITPTTGVDVAFAFLFITADILMMIFSGRMLAGQNWARTALVITSTTMAIFDLVSFNIIAQLFSLGYTGIAATGILLTITHLGLLLTAIVFAYQPPSSSFLNSSASAI